MSDWNWTRIDNRCNSLLNNAIHNRFGFQWQLFSLHSTGNESKINHKHSLKILEIHSLGGRNFTPYFRISVRLSGGRSIGLTLKTIERPRAHLSFFSLFFFLSKFRWQIDSIQVYVGQLSQQYEALSVEASKQTTAEEIVTCIVERLDLTVNIVFSFFSITVNFPAFPKQCFKYFHLAGCLCNSRSD